jgi:hypothetical protein
MEVAGILLAAIAIVWGILGLCMPFMVYSIMESGKANKRQLEELNHRLARLTQ